MTLLLVVIMAVLATSGGLVISRGRIQDERQHADAVRLQAIWLGRSAWESGLRGSVTVATSVGEARVVVEGTTVRVTLPGGEAEVQGEPYRERYRVVE